VSESDVAATVARYGSVLVFNGARVAVDLEKLHGRIVDGDNVGGDGSISRLDVSTFSRLLVELIKAGVGPLI
jgi:hypothetical protein